MTLTNNIPNSQTILICNETTSKEEITAFLFRVILCNTQILFAVVNSENLDIEKKEHMLFIFSKIYKVNQMKSCLSFIFIDRDLFNQFNIYICYYLRISIKKTKKNTFK